MLTESFEQKIINRIHDELVLLGARSTSGRSSNGGSLKPIQEHIGTESILVLKGSRLAKVQTHFNTFKALDSELSCKLNKKSNSNGHGPIRIRPTRDIAIDLCMEIKTFLRFSESLVDTQIRKAAQRCLSTANYYLNSVPDLPHKPRRKGWIYIAKNFHFGH